MRIAFSVQASNALRNFESVLRALGDRGHEVRILLHSDRHAPGSKELLERLVGEVPGLSWELAAHDLRGGRLGLAAGARASIDLLHFLHGDFHETYRERSLRRAPRAMRWVAESPLARRPILRRALAGAIGGAERLLPVARAVRARLAAAPPDLLLLTPYIGLKTVQPEYLRAGRALGIPTGVCVASWDNLTSKSLIRPAPDRVFVWNEVQRDEALRLHGVPPQRVVVTGAQCFDEWFTRRPSDRETFCARLGVDPGRPIVLYVCFTPFARAANQDEAAFVRRWLERVRGSGDETLRGATVVVRPHPKRLQAWDGVDLEPLGAVVFPRDARLPSDEESRRDYFDSLAWSSAVVGLNSTAMVEAAILGRPVLTVLAPEFWESQEGTLHFRYLREAGGGLLREARSLDEHVGQLAEAVRGDDVEAPERARRFVAAFIRPYGPEADGTSRFVEAVEQLGSARTEAPRERLFFAGIRRRRAHHPT